MRDAGRQRVLIISQFYKPEPCAAANRVSALASAFAGAGHQVTVLTGMPSFPQGTIEAAYRNRFFLVESDGDVAVHRVCTFAAGGGRARDRILHWISVACAMLVYVLLRKRAADIVVVSTPPITLVVPALVAAWRNRARLIADVRDVFPEVAIGMGVWHKDDYLSRAVCALVDRLYARASLVVAVTEGARAEILRHGVSPSKMIVAPNGADAVELAEEPPLVRKPQDFVVAYVGNMGVAAALETVLNAAILCREDPRVRFVMIGGGAHEPELRRRAQREGITNVEFLGVLPREAAVRALADSDVCIVPLRAGLTRSLPTKIFDAFAVGCPVIAAADGEARSFIEESGGGIAVEPENGPALAAAIRRLRSNPAQRVEYGRSGRRFLWQRYDRVTIMRELVSRVGKPVTSAR